LRARARETRRRQGGKTPSKRECAPGQADGSRIVTDGERQQRPSAKPRGPYGFRLLAAYVATALVAAFLTVRLTARGSNVSVPRLTGMNVNEVRRVLSGRGLEMAVTGEEWNEQYPVDCVVGQQPPPNARVKRGRRVKLTLSRGSQIIQMPKLAATSVDEAKFLLRQLGLETGSVNYVPDRDPRQTILAHDPPAGIKVARGHAVSLLVSGGPAAHVFAMPKVLGRPARSALSRLRKAGLKITEVTYETTTRYAGGHVISQDPPGGFRTVTGERVKLRATRSASTGLARYVTFRYTVEEGAARRVRVLIVDEGGRREIANDIEQGGSILRFSTRVQGEAVAQFFVAGTLAEERKI
jgi:serine/threonine-protein kinase